jgi:vacuolar-type H+-ATPase subunit E/Vma4
MSLDSIKKRILAESEQEAEKIHGEADSESRKIIAEARAKAREIEKQAQADSEAECLRLERENSAGLEIQSNSILLEAKGAAVEKVMSGIVHDVKSTISREYMYSLLKEGAKQFDAASGERFIVRTKKKNSKIVQSLKLTPKYDETEEGFVLESHDGKMRLMASPDSIIESNSDEIRREISDLLFGKAERKTEHKAEKEKMPGKKKGKKKR